MILLAAGRLFVLLIVFLAVSLFVWSLRGILGRWHTARVERARAFQRTLGLSRLPALSTWGQPLVAVGVGVLLGLIWSWGIGIAAMVVVWWAISTLPARLLKRHLVAFDRQLPDGLMVLAHSTRAGLTLPQAIERVASDQPNPIAHEFGRVASDYRHGRTIEQAIDDARGRLQSRNFDLAVRALRVGVERGGNIADTVEQISESIAEIWRVEEKIRTATAPGRSSARFMTLIPVGFFGFGMLMDAPSMMLLFTDPVGIGILFVIVLLALICNIWVRRLVDVDV